MSDQWEIPGQDANAANPYGQPTGEQQAGYPAPPPYYGAPGMPPGSGGYGYVPPQKQSNGLAIAGFILAILVWPLGLIFSIIGLVRSGKLGGAGKKLSIAGIIISLVIGGGSIALIVTVAKSTAADPGCVSAETSIAALEPKLTADENQLNADSSDPTALQTDITTLLTDMQTAKGDLDSAGAIATHQSVKTAISTMDTDLGTFITGIQAIQSGDSTNATQTEAVANRLGTDGDAVDNLCTTL